MSHGSYGHTHHGRNVSEALSEEEEEFRRALDSVPPPSPPDGGWGWVVVFASFMINAIVDGLCFSFGIIMPEFVYHFNLNRTSESEESALAEDHILKFVYSTRYSAYPTACVSLGGGLLIGVYMLSGK